MKFKENMVEIAAIVLNQSRLGDLRLEAPRWVIRKGSQMLPKTPIEVDYV